MHLLKKTPPLAVIVLAAVSSLLAAGPKPAKMPASNSMMMEMPLVAPLFVVDEQFNSTLVLVNGGSVETYADVTVRGLDGSTLATKRVNFSAHSQQQIDVRELLRSANSAATTGSITVMQSPDLTGPAIAAQLSLTYLTFPETNFIDEEFAMPSAEGSQVLRAVSDKADGSPLIALTSLSESLQHVQIDCLRHNGPKLSKTVELAAGETLLTEGCGADTIHGADFQTVRHKNKAEGPKGAFGIALTSDAMPGSFAAFALAPHKVRGEDFFSSVPFTDPKMLMSANAIFAGVPVGFATPLPPGEYVPELALANFSTRDVRVRIKYAYTSETNPVVQDLQPILLPPQSSRTITLDNLRGDPDLKNSFIVVPDGAAPGDVVAKIVAGSDSRLHEVELLGKDEQDVANAGTHPWTLEEDTESILLLFNHSTRGQAFTVLLSSRESLWQKTYQLKPMQTKTLSIGDLIKAQVKDDKGNTLPSTARSGAAAWFVEVRGNGTGRILQASRNLAMARNFSCGNVVDICGATFTPSTTILGVGDTVPFGSIAARMCWVYAFTCSGTEFTTGAYSNNYWNSQYSSIITTAAPYNQSSTNVTGVSPGLSYITGTVQNSVSPYCQASAGGTGTVQRPTYFFSPSAAQTSTPAACTQEGAIGYFLDVSYYVADANSNRISKAGMTPGENVQGVWHDDFATPTTTRSDGSFDDVPRGACYATSGHFCAAGSPQSFRLTNNGTVYSISTNTTSKECTDGIQLVIQGNPTAQNKTYTFGNTQ